MPTWFQPREDADLLTTGEVARTLNVHQETVRKWIREGLIPAIRTPLGKYRIRRETLEAILRGDYSLPQE